MLGAGIALLSLIVLIATGVPVLTGLLLIAAVALQAISGWVLWQYLLPTSGPVETLGGSLAIGTAAAALAGAFIPLPRGWGWVVPSALAIALVIWRRIQGWKPPEQWPPISRPEWMAIVVGGVLALGSLAWNVARYPLVWSGGWGGFHPDMVFFEALARSVARFGPWDSIFLPGAEIRYHWLTYAWAGQLTEATAAEPFTVLTRIVPLVSLISGVLLVAGWSGRLVRPMFVPTLAVVLLIAGGFVGVVYGAVLNFDSPSQSLTAVWLIAWTIFMLRVAYVNGELNGPPELPRTSLWWWTAMVSIAALTSALILGKVSTGAVAVAAGIVLWIYLAIAQRQWRIPVLGALLVALLAAFLTFLLFLSDGNGGGGISLGSLLNRASSEQGFNPLPGPKGVLAGTLIVAIAIGLRWGAVTIFFTQARWRSSPATALSLGLVLAGVGGVLLFNGGQNELWFATGAAAPLSALTAVAVGVGVSELRLTRPGLLSALLLGAAVLITVMVWWLWLTGPSGGNTWTSTLRWSIPFAVIAGAAVLGLLITWAAGERGPLAWWVISLIVLTLVSASGRFLGVGTGQLGLPPSTRNEFYAVKEPVVPYLDNQFDPEIPAEYLDAAALLRERANLGDRVVTNLTGSSMVAALTGLQTYASGSGYQGPYGRPGTEGLLRAAEADSWEFINAPQESTARPLCDAGVRWAWINPRRITKEPAPEFGEALYSGTEVLIISLEPWCA